MGGGVQNSVGHVPMHVSSGGSLGHDKELTKTTGLQSGRGELEESKVQVSDGGSRKELLKDSQETQGWMSWGWSKLKATVNLGGDVLGAAHEFVGQMHGLDDDDVELAPEKEGTDRPVVEDGIKDGGGVESVSDEEGPVRVLIGEVDEDGTVWYDALDEREDGEKLLLLQEIPISRGENLQMDKEIALLREGFRVKSEEQDSREIESMEQGLMQAIRGKASAAWNWLWGRDSKSESVSQDTRSVSEKNLSKIETLQENLANCMQKLDEQVVKVNGKDASILNKNIDPSKIKSDVSALGFQDHAWRWGETAKASFSQAVSTLGWCAAGAGIAYGGSTVSSLTGGGISGSLASLLGGAYVALSALRDLPENVANQTTVNLIEKSLVEINQLLGTAQELIVKEQHRQELSEKLGVMSQGRMETIERLELELEVVDRQLVGRKESGAEVKPVESQPRLPAVVGDGATRSETLSGMARVKQAFSSFFAPVVEGLSRAGRFLGDALGLTSLSMVKKMDRDEERAYVSTYAKGLRLLQQSSDDTIMNRTLVQQAARRMLGIPQERLDHSPSEVQQRIRQIEHKSDSMRPVLRLGENVVRHVREGAGGSFGTLIVTDKGVGRYVVNSGQPTVRAMCHYLDVLARDVGEKNTLGVKVDDSGSLVLHDPDRRLYQFLMGAPQAMTPLFMSPVGAGSQWREATEHAGRMWINDSSGQLPGGANRVVFEIGVDEGKDVLKLRFEHIDRDELVSSVLDVPEHSMSKQLKLMDTAYRDAYRSGSKRVAVDSLDDEALMRRYENLNKQLGVSGEDYGRWPLENLQERREQLLNRLAKEQVLLQRDNDSYQLLQNDDQLRVVTQRA
ncbi:hypothetical protein GCM10009108_16060 [Castellaniella ginsengisoli]|uniref:Uncharacterized protein n=1 Tax=Castellaniella ginsengisoli TaxID=546114 RepID=A0ABP3W789_9BURK